MSKQDPVDVLARTMYGEARGCGTAALEHVASVVMNREAHPRWWGHDVVSVCLAPMQFSCWNLDDPNHAIIVAVRADNPIFASCVEIASRAVAGALRDETDGADSYYAGTMRSPPVWASRGIKTLYDGYHQFVRMELAAPADPGAPAKSIHAIELEKPMAHASPHESDADDLNKQELDKLKED